MNRTTPPIRHLFAGLLAASFALGCDDGNPCDPGQELYKNACVEEIPGSGGSGGGTGSGGATGGASGMGGGGGAPAESVFGRECTEDTQCEEPAPLCGKAPGATDGYCTAPGCDSAGIECPPGWSCLSFADVCTQ